MKKVTRISIKEPYKLIFHFNNGESRLLDLEKVLDINQPFAKKVFQDNTYSMVEIDSFGGIFWDSIAEIRELDGSIKPCEFDISPEFAYYNSDPI